MCIFKPKIPKVEPLPPPPVVKDAPEPPKDEPEARPLEDPEDKPDVTYGSPSSNRDSLMANQGAGGGSIVNLNRQSLNSAGANQQGLGGGTMS